MFGVVMDTILEKFPKDFFPTIAINESHPLFGYREFNFKDILKKNKPMLLASPKYDFDYDGDPFSDNPFGINMMHLPDGEGEPVLRDYENNIFLSVSRFVEIKADIGVRFRVESRSQQMEYHNYINNAFRMGHNIILYKDIEYPISNDFIVQIAKDLSFELKQDIHGVDHVKDDVAMLSYLNSHSFLKFVCKYNTHVGYSTYGFIFPGVQVRIDMTDKTNPDDGERKGSLNDNFNIDCMFKVYMNAPHSYMYHSEFPQILPQFEALSDLYLKSIMNYVITLYHVQVPKINENGWNILTSHQYFEEDLTKNISGIPVLDLIGKLPDIVELLKHREAFPPEMYIDIKFHNNGTYLPVMIDWVTNEMSIDGIAATHTSEIFIYANSKYIHDAIDVIKS
jgi:hypothetical protein